MATTATAPNAAGVHWHAEDGDVVFPGDVLMTIPESEGLVVRVGRGVTRRGSKAREHADSHEMVALYAGTVRVDAGRNKVWVDCDHAKRYMPSVDDLVVGVVAERFADGYRVDIGGAETALLGALEFQGATKRNRPSLKVGDVVYARVTVAHRMMEPEISCILPGSNKSWLSGESELGPLQSEATSMFVDVSLGYARYLLTLTNGDAMDSLNSAGDTRSVISLLSQKLNFELAVGVNGRVWIRTNDPQHTILIALTVQNAQHLPIPQQIELAQRAIATL